MMNPITFNEVADVSTERPELVYTIFNELIKKNWDGKKAVLLLTDIIDKICKDLDVSREVVNENRWVYIREHYEQAGWEVTAENHNPYYSVYTCPTITFRKKKGKKF